jgi:acetyl esterase/lipase
LHLSTELFKNHHMKKIIQFLPALLFPVLLYAQDSSIVIHLWNNGAPGFENRKNEPEQAKDYWVKNINDPSLTVYFPPKGKANGAAVIICPGGGHKELVFNAEGKEAATYFNSIGVTAFVLKYRLYKEENSPYTIYNTVSDGSRAMRLVRHEAAQFNIDTNRIGLTGFSAGGELAGWVAFDTYKDKISKPDDIDKEECKANFLILIYPGPAVVPDTIRTSAPPLFMVAANDDDCCSLPVIQLLQLYRKAKVKTEVHLYAQGSHAFNMGNRSALHSIHTWPQRMGDWLADNGYLKNN